jgi:hypothetical protein
VLAVGLILNAVVGTVNNPLELVLYYVEELLVVKSRRF